MVFEILAIVNFKRELKALSKRHRSIVNDVKNLIEDLKKDPNLGTEIAFGIRKIRMAITSKGRGKSGGARIITYTFIDNESGRILYLISIYDKADFSTVDLNLIKEIIDTIE